MSADPFAGKWKLHASTNMEEFMKVMGAPWFVRKMAGSSYPTCEVAVNGDHYHFKMHATGWSWEIEFDIGKEFLQKQMDNSQKKSIVVRDGDKLVQRVFHEGFEEVTTREVKDGELVMTLQAKDVTAIRRFKRI